VAGLLAAPSLAGAVAVAPDVASSVTSIDFGTQQATTVTATPVPGTPYTVTLTYTGTATTVTAQAATITGGTKPGWFSVTSDGCANVNLTQANPTCSDTIVPTPADQSVGTGTLTVPITGDATTALTVALSVTGSTAPPLVATPGPGFAHISWGTLPTTSIGPAQGYELLKGTSPTNLIKFGQDVAATPYSFDDTAVTGGTVYYYQVRVFENNALQITSPPVAVAPWQAGGPGTFISLPPSRLLDTRTSNGGHNGAIGTTTAIHLQVAGRGGVPSTGVGSVELNITGTGPTAPTYLSVFPTGHARPNTSILNLVKGQIRADAVTVLLGTNGQVDIYNAAGAVNVVVDVVGFYANTVSPVSLSSGGQFHQLDAPVRVYDSRLDTKGQLPGHFIAPILFGFSPADAPHIKAVAINLTAVGGHATGYLTAYDGASNAPPTASTLNYTPSVAISNMAIVPVSTCNIDPSCAGVPMIGIANGSVNSVDIVVDIVGYFDDNSLEFGLRYHSLANPTRLVDTRTGFGIAHALGGGQTQTIDPGPIGDLETFALNYSVTAVMPTNSTYLVLWADFANPIARPATSNLNALPGQIVASHALPSAGDGNLVNIYNRTGTTNVLVDVAGTYESWPVVFPGAASPAVAGAHMTTAQQATVARTARYGQLGRANGADLARRAIQ
jgi:hypothetical protein